MNIIVEHSIYFPIENYANSEAGKSRKRERRGRDGERGREGRGTEGQRNRDGRTDIQTDIQRGRGGNSCDNK